MVREVPDKMRSNETPEKIMETVKESALKTMGEELAGSLMDTPRTEKEVLESFDNEVRGLLKETREKEREVLDSSVKSREALADEIIGPLV